MVSRPGRTAAQTPGVGDALRLAADAMCGGLARWLRLAGVDTSFTPGIDDAELVRQALAESRIVLTSDQKLLERRVFTTGRLGYVRLPVGLRREAQFLRVVETLHIRPGWPRCTVCNGRLLSVPRGKVADRVPARTLIWLREFYRCTDCDHVFWRGSHWRRIAALLDRIDNHTA